MLYKYNLNIIFFMLISLLLILLSFNYQKEIVNFFDKDTFVDYTFFWNFLLFFTNPITNTFVFILLYLYVRLFFLKNIITFKLKSFLSLIVFTNLFNLFLFNFDDLLQLKNFNYFNINKELHNGILLVHPLMTYITYVSVYNIYINTINKGIYTNLFYLNFYKNIFLFCYVSLLLGALWAVQEVGWGGLWNWDPVEVVLLLFLLVMVFFIHNINLQATLFDQLYFNNYNIVFLLIFFLSIRFDIFKSIHSFIILGGNLKLNVWIVLFILYVCISVFKYRFNYIERVMQFHSSLQKNFCENKIHSQPVVIYRYIYFMTVFYVFIITANTHFFEYELNEFLLFYRRFLFFLCLYIFLFKLLRYSSFLFKFNVFLLFTLSCVYFHKCVYLYTCSFFYFIFKKINKHNHVLPKLLILLHVIILLLLLILLPRLFFTELLNIDFDTLNFTNKLLFLNENFIHYFFFEDLLGLKLNLFSVLFKNSTFLFENIDTGLTEKNFFFNINHILFYCFTFFLNIFIIFVDTDVYCYSSLSDAVIIYYLLLFILVVCLYFYLYRTLNNLF